MLLRTTKKDVGFTANNNELTNKHGWVRSTTIINEHTNRFILNATLKCETGINKCSIIAW